MTSISFKKTIRSKVLSGSAIAGLAALMLTTGLPAPMQPAFADAVRVNAPHVPGFAEIVEAVTPAVVSVRVRSNRQAVNNQNGFNFDFGEGFDNLPNDHPMKRFFKEFERRGLFGEKKPTPAPGKRKARPISQGSGFFITEDGFLVTNNHVVDKGTEFTIIMHDGSEHEAKLIGKDARTDLAVLKVTTEKKLTYVGFADDAKTRIGEWVVAVGNPFGLGGTVTAGIISARGRDIGAGPYDDFIQVDAAVNRGNSGGPTFNLNGEVIGVNTAIFSPSGGNVGIAFAIPASLAKQVVEDLMDDGNVKRGWLGVSIQTITQDVAESLGLEKEEGALVSNARDGSPAQKAGIKAGDVITQVNGNAVKDPKDLARQIADISPNDIAKLTVMRRGEEVVIDVKIGTLKDTNVQKASIKKEKPVEKEPQELADLGMLVEPVEDGDGVSVLSIDKESDAAERGIRIGDTIVSINGVAVASADDITKGVESALEKGRKAALFEIQGKNGSRFVALPINKG